MQQESDGDIPHFYLTTQYHIFTKQAMTPTTNLEIHETLPKTWFIAKGSGHSNNGHEGGSFPHARSQAGLRSINTFDVGYSLPIHSYETSAGTIPTGSILPAITSVAHGIQGETITAGIVFGKVTEIETGAVVDVVLCKNTYHESERYARKLILNQLEETYTSIYDTDLYSLSTPRLILQETHVSQAFGTAFVSICFKTVLYPVAGL